MLRLGVVVLLFLSLMVFLGFARASSARARPVQHTCGLTDRQFLTVYDLQLQAVGMYGTDYMNGDAKAQDAISAAKEAAIAVRSSAPFDPTLQTVKHLAPPMFLEFGKAVKLRAAGKDASRATCVTRSAPTHCARPGTRSQTRSRRSSTGSQPAARRRASRCSVRTASCGRSYVSGARTRRPSAASAGSSGARTPRTPTRCAA